MPVPTLITDLSTTIASNSPAGSESPADGDNYIRALSGFVAQLRDGTGFSTTADIAARSITTTGNNVLGNAVGDTLNVAGGSLQVDASGNVGIGAAAAAGYKLDVTAAAAASGLVALRADAGQMASLRLAGHGQTPAAGSFDLQQDATGQVDIVQRFNGRMSFYTNNLERLQITADGRIYGAALHNNAGAVTGTTNQYIASGTYTPTGTGVLNISAITPNACQWLRVGNVVTVSGSVDITTTNPSVATSFRLSLPIASDLAAASQLSGSGEWNATTPFRVSGDTTNNEASLLTTPTLSGAAAGNTFTFTYVVL